MSKAKSAEVAAIPGLKAEQASGTPLRSQPSVQSTLPEGMKAPSAPGEQDMGGVRKGGDSSHIGHESMSHARALLEQETERGAHVAEVAGHKMHEHSGRMGHKA